MDLLPEFWTDTRPTETVSILTRLKAELAALSSSSDSDTDEPEADDWTPEEDFALVKWALALDRDWRQVSCHVLGRSAEECHKRWLRVHTEKRASESWEAVRREIEAIAKINQDLSLRKASAYFHALRTESSQSEDT